MSEESRIHTLVIKGGASKGIAYAGVFEVLFEQGQNRLDTLRHLAGASAGTLAVLVLALARVKAGGKEATPKSWSEALQPMLRGLSEPDVSIEIFGLSKNRLVRALYPSAILRLLHKGAAAGPEGLESWIEQQFEATLLQSRWKTMTWQELADDSGLVLHAAYTDPTHGVRIVSAEPKGTTESTLHSAADEGPLTAESFVADIVRASSALPFAFEPVHTKETPIVDGGVRANLPVEQIRDVLGMSGASNYEGILAVHLRVGSPPGRQHQAAPPRSGPWLGMSAMALLAIPLVVDVGDWLIGPPFWWDDHPELGYWAHRSAKFLLRLCAPLGMFWLAWSYFARTAVYGSLARFVEALNAQGEPEVLEQLDHSGGVIFVDVGDINTFDLAPPPALVTGLVEAGRDGARRWLGLPMSDNKQGIPRGRSLLRIALLDLGGIGFILLMLSAVLLVARGFTVLVDEDPHIAPDKVGEYVRCLENAQPCGGARGEQCEAGVNRSAWNRLLVDANCEQILDGLNLSECMTGESTLFSKRDVMAMCGGSGKCSWDPVRSACTCPAPEDVRKLAQACVQAHATSPGGLQGLCDLIGDGRAPDSAWCRKAEILPNYLRSLR